MTAAFRRSLLALVLAAQAAAARRAARREEDRSGRGKDAWVNFAPGGRALGPHVRMPQMVPGIPRGHNLNLNTRSGARFVLPPKRQARFPTMTAANKPAFVLDVPILELAAAPVDVPHNATEIIAKWIRDAASARGGRLGSHGDNMSKVISDAQKLLVDMHRAVATGESEYVLALASGGEADDIQAVADVNLKYFPADSVRLMSPAQGQGQLPNDMIEVALVQGIVATPEPNRESGVGAKLIRRIVEWAATIGCLVMVVPLNDELEQYYERLGFRPINSNSAYMVYNGSVWGASARRHAHQFMALAH